MTLGTNILQASADQVARTPVSRPRAGKLYEHRKHGVVTVTRVEDGMVVFTRPDDNTGHAYINDRQEPLPTFEENAVEVS